MTITFGLASTEPMSLIDKLTRNQCSNSVGGGKLIRIAGPDISNCEVQKQKMIFMEFIIAVSGGDESSSLYLLNPFGPPRGRFKRIRPKLNLLCDLSILDGGKRNGSPFDGAIGHTHI